MSSPTSRTETVIKDNEPLLESNYCISIANQQSQHTQQSQHSSTQQRSAQLTSSTLSVALSAGLFFSARAKMSSVNGEEGVVGRGGKGGLSSPPLAARTRAQVHAARIDQAPSPVASRPAMSNGSCS